MNANGRVNILDNVTIMFFIYMIKYQLVKKQQTIEML